MGTIFDIKRFAIHDGPGLRTTVFLKGCPLSCLGCHNPEGQRVGPELLFRPDRCTACGDCVPACPNDAISLTKDPGSESGKTRPSIASESATGSESSRSESPITVHWDRCELTGACVNVCLPGALELVGRTKSVEEILDILEDDRVYFDESRGGVTFSGGEPFSQPDFLRDLLRGCRERELPVVLDTCGHVAPETFMELAPLSAALLFDLKLMDEGRHEAFTGVHNRWILENLKWVGDGCGAVGPGLDAPKVAPPAEGNRADGAGDEAGRGSRIRLQGSCPDLTVRLPLIPGVNDDEENLMATAAFLRSLGKIPRLDILPYHRLGVEKYHRTGRAYSLSTVAPPPDGSVGKAVRLLREAGLDVTVRGERYGDD